MRKRILVVLMAMLMGITMLTGCAGDNKTDVKKFGSLNDFVGATIAEISGGAFDALIQEKIGDTQISWVKDNGSAVEAVKSNKADAMVTDKPVAYKAAAVNPELQPFPIAIDTYNYAYIFRKGSELVEKVNSALQQLKDSGKTKELEEYWITDPVSDPVVEPQKSTGANGTVKIAVDVSFEPMVFMNGEGQVIGYDIALCNQIFDILNMKAEYIVISFDSLVENVNTGKADLAAGPISITDERRQNVDFCDVTYAGEATLLVQKDRIAPELLSAAVDSEADLEQKLQTANFGVMQGSTAIAVLQRDYPNAVISEFDSISDAVSALQANKVDYVMTAYSTCKNYERYNKDLITVNKVMADEEIAAAVRKGNTELLDKVNAILDKYMSDGTMDAIFANWMSDDGSDAPYDQSGIPAPGEDAPVLNVGIAANREPMCFIKDNGYAGVDCELIERIAYELGMRVEYQDMTFSSLIPSLESNRVDIIISSVTVTEERSQVVDFTHVYFQNPQVLLMRKADAVAATDNTEITKSGWDAFWSGLKDSFTRTFITENRWKLVLNGLGVTVLISLCAFVIGSLWGGVICALLRSKRKIASVPARVYVRLLQGTPIVVLLMILYYIVFKSVDISAIIVAIIGFALNLGAYTSQIFKTAIDSVDKGQIEAASAMGFNKFQVFIKIIFPQAARNALPVYKGEFISLVKSTSIVGYIAIQDLTKVSDIIRSRTYEAFFPLIATAVIYFVVTYIFIVLLNVVEKKIDPKRRKRIVKGVETK